MSCVSMAVLLHILGTLGKNGLDSLVGALEIVSDILVLYIYLYYDMQ